MTMMSSSARLEEMQSQDEKLDTAMALSEIRTQLQELTKSVESCQTEVTTLSTVISCFCAQPVRGVSVVTTIRDFPFHTIEKPS